MAKKKSKADKNDLSNAVFGLGCLFVGYSIGGKFAPFVDEKYPQNSAKGVITATGLVLLTGSLIIRK